MKKHMLPLLLAAFFALSLTACNTQETGSSSQLESGQESSQLSSAPSPSPSQVEAPSSGPDAREGDSQPSAPEETLLQIAVGGEIFLADLADTAAAQEIASMLPISLVMADQNGVVKRYDLPSALPEAAEDFSTVPAGQLVLEGTGGLRLFYQESPAGGSYTPLATLRETEGLAQALAGESVEVTLQLVTG